MKAPLSILHTHARAQCERKGKQTERRISEYVCHFGFENVKTSLPFINDFPTFRETLSLHFPYQF